MTRTIFCTLTILDVNISESKITFKTIDVQIFLPNYAVPGISDFLTQVTNRNIKDKKEQVRDLREGNE